LYKHYLETIPIPTRWLQTISTIAAVFITVLAGTMNPDPQGDRIDVRFLAMLFTISWCAVFAMLWLTKSVRVSVENMLQWSGERGPTLVVRGNTRSSKSYIPLAMIEDVTEVTFEGPWWKSTVSGAPPDLVMPATAEKPDGWQTFLHMRDEHSTIPVGRRDVFGYRGPGLLVTWRARAPNTGTKELFWRDQFPTADPEKLMSILKRNSQESSD